MDPSTKAIVKIEAILQELIDVERAAVLKYLSRSVTVSAGAARQRRYRKRHESVTSDITITSPSDAATPSQSDVTETSQKRHESRSLAVVDSDSESASRSKGSGSLEKRRPKVAKEAQVAPRATEPGVQAILTAYHEEFLRRFGEKPNLNGKDGAIAKDLLRRHGFEKVQEVMLAMFDSADPFLVQAGPSLPILSSQWNKLVAHGAMNGGVMLSPGTKTTIKAGQAWARRNEHDGQ